MIDAEQKFIEHFEEAELLLARVTDADPNSSNIATVLALAKLHTGLATAAATAMVAGQTSGGSASQDPAG